MVTEESVEEQPGSGQDADSLAKDFAAQPALLAAAAEYKRQRAEAAGIQTELEPATAPAATMTLLTVMYAEKDTVKALGATWDASSKEWFALPGVPLEPLRRYIDRKRIYLNVPFGEKDDAKAAGAQYELSTKRWYVPVDVPQMGPFTRWLSLAPAQTERIERSRKRAREIRAAREDALHTGVDEDMSSYAQAAAAIAACE